jgi:hypothetical protein
MTQEHARKQERKKTAANTERLPQHLRALIENVPEHSELHDDNEA